MKTLLQVNSSLFGENGQSTRLSEQFVAAWQQAHPQGRVISRSLAASPVPHLDGARFGAFLSKPEDRTPEQQQVVDFSDSLIEELRAADVIVLGVPLYNFGVPSQLKAWFDHVARAGVTFRYTENGPVGLLGNKKVYVFATRGGLYAGTPKDTASAWLRDILGFIGLTDVEIVYAEGLSLGEDSQKASLARAQDEVRQLVEPLRAAA
ncbi:FMN-dependent NADH-azoreductase [Noviherbaspirillum aridicola]|uniref:FMN dependent NADH:quinone oxidoreductase n=1 Tax=Noviherbaspirillum aridicola TaxID=2849687 RepID=A0ABQ4Q3C2_9BURK|nr:NAD(P)H-dependent oxidoreductase [Noviherbaspirillum aridicola]GIZ51644.1 FMN-dependent NADH-azoreductase [Noviherbaspirillum aridicola]